MQKREFDPDFGFTASEPEMDRIEEHCRRWSISKPQTYRDLGAGRYIARKMGKATLIDVASARKYFNSLPVFKPTAKPPVAE
jgi:hypothetical protein